MKSQGDKAQYGQKRLVWVPPTPLHILNSLSLAYKNIRANSRNKWTGLRTKLSPTRLTDENETRLRTTSRTSRFIFDEESLNKSVVGSPLVAKPTSQERYSLNWMRIVGTDWCGPPAEHSSSSFCKEPDRLLTICCVREEREKTQSGSLGVNSEPIERWFA